ncbi:hypothetical protein L210DRAFT_3658007 [Boletus edulis BED1]|uniref:CxC2-like cysteine cluster KDZ transposase-associated domain-containing protein n=1 Tax=Boletus edulis BED1 TaxID=1328754 RepID=A0AAD4BAS9_BOLED|nr:hypothetical protein L210DRAFT_3658007 [Boletus edulis BED1]
MGPTADSETTQPQPSLHRALQRSLKAAQKGIKKPGTTTFLPEQGSSKSVQVDTGPANAASVAREALARLSERRFRNYQRHNKSPSTTILHRETATITKTRIHSAFQGSKAGSISHSRPFISSTQPLSDPTLTESVNNVSPAVDPECWVYSPNNVFPEEHSDDHRSRKRTAAEHPLLTWLPDRDTFLEEFIRFEGRGRCTDICPLCGTDGPSIRCTDCFGGELLCITCAVDSHARNPLHIVKKWNGISFESTTLRDLGLRVQLGHLPTRPCHNPERCAGDLFIVIDTTGIHPVALDFCNCESATSHFQQLLRMAWFPATSSRPQSAATFRVLKQFQLLSLESKISSYEYYNSLVRLVDNTGLMDIKNRYEAFLRMTREWRHLKMLKRAGRGHVAGGAASTHEGECAVLCPACPHPGINIPLDINNSLVRSSGSEKSWRHALFVTIDANFRLKRKKVSSDTVDPSLSQGWAYFVEEASYKKYLEGLINRVQEKSTCSSHLAVNMADTMSRHGLAATGVGTVDCARHNMKLPTGVGDLQKGEKYINMDYLLFSMLRHNSTNILNISYDIACQWSKNLSTRIVDLPSSMQFPLSEKRINFLVPKFHLPAHVEKCQTTYSFNFTKGVGRTDGEAPERGWANINPVASSTKEMGPGARRDTLDDHFGHSNWKKVVSLRHSLLQKLKTGITKCAEHRDVLEELEKALLSSQSNELIKWRSQVEDYESNPTTKVNPYERQGNVMTMASVQLQLAKYEAEDLEKGCTYLNDICSPSVLISTGLELEELQRRLRRDKAGLGINSTDNRNAHVLQHSNDLQRRIDAWAKLQYLFLPLLAVEREKEAGDSDTSCILKFKDRFLRGQGANTRARNTLKAVEARIDAAANRYDDARKALVKLAPLLRENNTWQTFLRSLNRQDIRAMSDLVWGETEGTRKLSWIWCMGGAVEGADEGALEDMRIEWCKARARAARWSEDVDLLMDEMERTLAFFQWDAARWEERMSFVPAAAGAAEGHHAYAHRQATLRKALVENCRRSWESTMELVRQLDKDWNDGNKTASIEALVHHNEESCSDIDDPEAVIQAVKSNASFDAIPSSTDREKS